MRVLLTSDLHGNLPEIPECDVLIIAGDVCPDFASTGRYDQGEVRQAAWLGTKFREWLEDIPAKHVIGIAGNHDFVFDTGAHLVPKGLPWHYLIDSSIIFEGLTFYGTPWVPNLPGWAFYGGDGGVDIERLDKMPDHIDVLISHGPPRGYGDMLARHSKWGNGDEIRVGCTNMNSYLVAKTPKLFVCGHIHESFGHYRHPNVELGIFNVSFVDEMYVPRGIIEEIEL